MSQENVEIGSRWSTVVVDLMKIPVDPQRSAR
jgi:hypothetical protein